MSTPCENCGSDFRVCIDCDLYNGKYIEIPNNATNGQVIQMIFPNGVMLDKDECVGFEIMLDDKHSYCSFFDYIWWNALYQKEDKNE